jgi:hypothetical protein
MPNYQKLTIKAEEALLNQLTKKIEDVDAKLNTKGIAEGPKGSLQEQRGKLVTQIGQAIDKVVNACDVAEHNNRVYCKYIVDAHEAAKDEMNRLQPLLTSLEHAWDDGEGFRLNHAVGQVETWAKRLKTDDEELRAVNMVEEYRGNGWKVAITEGLKYATDRAGAFAEREKNRLDGIALSTKVVGSRNRVNEYLERAHAMQKTATQVLAKAMGEKKDLGKMRDELIDFAAKTEKSIGLLLGEFTGTINQLDRLVKTVLGTKVPNKDTFKPALLFEPKIDVFLKDAKGKAKTYRVLYNEEAKKTAGLGERYTKVPLASADAAIKKLEAAIEDFPKKAMPLRKVIELSKKFK